MSTNNPTSGQAQEDVKKVPHEKQKIQGAEKYAMDHAHDDFYKNFKPDPEVVLQMKNKQDVKYKLPSEVEQRFDDGFVEHVQLNEYGDWDVLLKNEPDKMYQFIATEQVALLTRVLGLIEKLPNPHADEYDEVREISYGRHSTFEDAKQAILTLLQKET